MKRSNRRGHRAEPSTVPVSSWIAAEDLSPTRIRIVERFSSLKSGTPVLVYIYNYMNVFFISIPRYTAQEREGGIKKKGCVFFEFRDRLIRKISVVKKKHKKGLQQQC